MIVNLIFHQIHVPFYDIESDIFIRRSAKMDTFVHNNGIKKINLGKNVRFYPAYIHGRDPPSSLRLLNGVLLCQPGAVAGPAQPYYNIMQRKSRYFIKKLLHLLL